MFWTLWAQRLESHGSTPWLLPQMRQTFSGTTALSMPQAVRLFLQTGRRLCADQCAPRVVPSVLLLLIYMPFFSNSRCRPVVLRLSC